MAGSGRITLSSADLGAAVRDLNDASGVFSASAPPLRTAIPGNAFGALGTSVAVAGNAVGAGFGVLLGKLATLASETASAAKAADTEFTRIEDDAETLFRALESGI